MKREITQRARDLGKRSWRARTKNASPVPKTEPRSVPKAELKAKIPVPFSELLGSVPKTELPSIISGERPRRRYQPMPRAWRGCGPASESLMRSLSIRSDPGADSLRMPTSPLRRGLPRGLVAEHLVRYIGTIGAARHWYAGNAVVASPERSVRLLCKGTIGQV